MYQPMKTAPKNKFILIRRAGGMPPVVAKWFGGMKSSAGAKDWPAEWRGTDTASTILGCPTGWMDLPPGSIEETKAT